MTKKPIPQPKAHQDAFFNMRIPRGLKEHLKLAAAKQHRTLSNYILATLADAAEQSGIPAPELD